MKQLILVFSLALSVNLSQAGIAYQSSQVLKLVPQTDCVQIVLYSQSSVVATSPANYTSYLYWNFKGFSFTLAPDVATTHQIKSLEIGNNLLANITLDGLKNNGLLTGNLHRRMLNALPSSPQQATLFLGTSMFVHDATDASYIVPGRNSYSGFKSFIFMLFKTEKPDLNRTEDITCTQLSLPPSIDKLPAFNPTQDQCFWIDGQSKINGKDAAGKPKAYPLCYDFI